MIDTIYIARHGFRLNWINTNWKSETGLPRDPPLAAFGITQAQELAAHFLSLPEADRPTAIFSSPYYRCIQTSEPVARALNVPIYIEHGLSEWYSPVKPGTGLHPRPGSATSLASYFSPDLIDTSWKSIYYPSRKGETVEAVHDRTARFLDVLIPQVDELEGGKHKKILLVSHAATVITLIRELAGDRSIPVRVGCCSLSEARRKTGETKGWDIIKVAEGDFLKEGLQRQWGLEDITIDGDGQVVEDDGVPGTENEADEPVGCVLQRSSNL